MMVCAAAEGLFLYQLVWDVNEKLVEQKRPPITAREYGMGFFDQIFREHQRLFPESSKRTWFVLIFFTSVIGFAIWDVF